MQVKIVVIFFIILIFNRNFSDALEIDSKLENNFFITRAIYKKAEYSFCFINGLDIKNTEPIVDFSFENNFIRAGRIKRLGVWKELFSPMGVSANSDLFNESTGFVSNYLFNKGGLYGLSLEMEEGIGISLLFPDNLWFGVKYTRDLDPFLITAFTSASVYSNSPAEEWTSTYSVIPNTTPIHLGLHSIFQLPNFTLDYLGTLSGSSMYKVGSYNRLFFELFGKSVSLKGFGGIISPYYINTDLKLSDTKYLLSLYLWLRLFKNWELVFKTEYKEDHNPVLPAAYIPTFGSSSAKLIYDNSFFIFSTELGQEFDFDIYGNESLENNINGKLGVSAKYSAFFYYDYTFDFDKIIKRKFEIQLKVKFKHTDLEFVLKHSEEIYKTANEKTLRFRVDQKLGTGDLFFKIEIGSEWDLEGLSIGFSTVCLEEK
ncbi:MAG: hypothetical protein KAQ93_03260 [Spirochaetales bacterium]|nr:hypothetical protein [Spirochaetales bacterium]